MKQLKLLAIVLLVPFTALTAYAIQDVGLIGVFEHQLANGGGMQVFADLAIALVFVLCWLIPDAKKRGRTPWPYVLLTLAAGSFGPLLYFALHKEAGAG